MVKRVLIFVGLLGTASVLHAQATPAASRLGDLQIGAGYSNANSDYSPTTRYQGFAIYGDFDFIPHFGVEAEFHLVSEHTSNQYYEKTYEVGGRYFRTYGPFIPYAKLMVGRGVFNYQFSQANLAYNMFAAGAGLDYKLRSYLNLRGDFEYQRWNGFPPRGLAPTVVTVGVAYHFK